MSALIATIAQGGRAWLSTDGRYRRADGRIEDAPLHKGGLACGGSAVVAGQGLFDILDRFCAWATPLMVEAAVEGGSTWLRANAPGAPQSIVLVAAGRGCCWIFDDGYEPHPLEPGAGHFLRPVVAFDGLEDAWDRAADGRDVEAFHAAYLARAAAAAPGLVDLHGMPAAIGGPAMCARITAAGVELVELGALDGAADEPTRAQPASRLGLSRRQGVLRDARPGGAGAAADGRRLRADDGAAPGGLAARLA